MSSELVPVPDLEPGDQIRFSGQTVTLVEARVVGRYRRMGLDFDRFQFTIDCPSDARLSERHPHYDGHELVVRLAAAAGGTQHG